MLDFKSNNDIISSLPELFIALVVPQRQVQQPQQLVVAHS
jgi:hypothetical protein